MTVLLTGATGTLGSHLLRRLVQARRDVICLVRGSTDAEANTRIRAMIGAHSRVAVVRGDIREPLCGLAPPDAAALVGRVVQVLHCAASIDFLDADAAASTNVQGIRNVLQLADAIGAEDVRHVSTAYVAGDASHFAENQLDAGQVSRNPYESSKRAGEAAVHRWATEREGRRFAIYRPSILVGCEDGSIPAFDAYYTYFKPIALAAHSMRRRERNRLPEGISVDDSGVVRLPIVVQLLRAATLNLVPLDWVADTILDLLKRPGDNKTYHLVHPRPPTVGWLWETSLRALRIEGAQVVRTQAEKVALVGAMPSVLARLQRGVDRVLDAYLPYTMGEAVFSDSQLRGTLQGAYRPPPPLDEAYLARLLGYAEAMNWESGGLSAMGKSTEAA